MRKTCDVDLWLPHMGAICLHTYNVQMYTQRRNLLFRNAGQTGEICDDYQRQTGPIFSVHLTGMV